jgi:hypothetical protein
MVMRLSPQIRPAGAASCKPPHTNWRDRDGDSNFAILKSVGWFGWFGGSFGNNSQHRVSREPASVVTGWI